MATKILLVDDDVELISLLREYLERDGFDVNVAHDADSGVREVATSAYELVVLDVMMPGKSGLEALRLIRALTAIPVVMLTARGDDADCVLGLELGADDYVAKPCSPRQLAARIRAILKRASGMSDATTGPIATGSLILWPDQRRCERNGSAIDLTSTEFNLLEMLARHIGQPVSKTDLSQAVLGRPLCRFDRTIDVHVSRIRQKLGNLADGRSCIQTVIRRGYQLIAD